MASLGFVVECMTGLNLCFGYLIGLALLSWYSVVPRGISSVSLIFFQIPCPLQSSSGHTLTKFSTGELDQVEIN